MKPLPILLLAASLLANVAFFNGTLRSPLCTAGAAAPTSGTTVAPTTPAQPAAATAAQPGGERRR